MTLRDAQAPSGQISFYQPAEQYPLIQQAAEQEKWRPPLDANQQLDRSQDSANTVNVLDAYRFGMVRAHKFDDLTGIVNNAREESELQTKTAAAIIATPLAAAAFSAFRHSELSTLALTIGAAVSGISYAKMMEVQEKQKNAIANFGPHGGDALKLARSVADRVSTAQELTWGAIPAILVAMAPSPVLKAGGLGIAMGLEGYSVLSGRQGRSEANQAGLALTALQRDGRTMWPYEDP
ncbi:MAG TPA: hypothetical protein V6C81_20780 [Planktothrix sp.]